MEDITFISFFNDRGTCYCSFVYKGKEHQVPAELIFDKVIPIEESKQKAILYQYARNFLQ